MLDIQFDTLILGMMIGAIAALLSVRGGGRTSGPTAHRRRPDEPN
jgi:hypothetical protein